MFNRIFDGTDEIQKLVIARELIKLNFFVWQLAKRLDVMGIFTDWANEIAANQAEIAPFWLNSTVLNFAILTFAIFVPMFAVRSDLNGIIRWLKEENGSDH